MTVLPIPAGFTNKEAIDFGYLALGLSDAMFGRTNEEYAAGLTMLRAMMAEWPFDQLGFDDSVATVAEESGVAQKWLAAVGYALGDRIGGIVGKTMKPASLAAKAKSYSMLCAAVGNKSVVSLTNGTARGSGHRNRSRGVYFAEVK